MTANALNEVRIVARIRPLLPHEHEKDIVVRAEGNSITIPNPKNEKETFSFPFHSIYDMESNQAAVFQEVSPTLSHLFKGNDVTIFAHGVTGSGKTYTMKGNKAPVERGVIPRILTAIYRRGKDMEKKTDGNTTMSAIMSYYEIYNDRIFDLFEAPEKRTLAGLPLREAHGKTHVVGLKEMEISTLKDFETLYDKANNNRSTSSTKLNAHSSRSHAVMCVRVRIHDKTTGETKTGQVSCIDLAGSEDNRRTANDKERMVESASINKSLFVLAQCVEAMTKKQSRIPYRESKMTRILSLGQNNGMTIMILNLAPTKSYHQDTLQALNFANRAKKIEIKNTAPKPPSPQPQPILPRSHVAPTIPGAAVRSFGTHKSSNPSISSTASTTIRKKTSLPNSSAPLSKKPLSAKPLSSKPLSNTTNTAPAPLRPQNAGIKKPAPHRRRPSQHKLDKENADIESIVERKVAQLLAAAQKNQAAAAPPPVDTEKEDQNAAINRRLEQLEAKLSQKADARAEGLTYILLAKQHASRGETVAAIKMYQLAQEYFPENAKLAKKIADLQEQRLRDAAGTTDGCARRTGGKKTFAVFTDDAEEAVGGREGRRERPVSSGVLEHSPRTRRLLGIVNSEDVSEIMKLKGVGKKRAEALVEYVREARERNEDDFPAIRDLKELGMIKGIGAGMVENMRSGIAVSTALDGF